MYKKQKSADINRIKLSKRRQSSEMLQLTFKNLPKSAGIEGGPFEVKKIFFGPKSFFWGREHFLSLVSTQNFEFFQVF